MMSASCYSYTTRLYSLFQIKTRCFHTSRISLRKQYNYDLDSLIEWKKETSKCFGSVCKLTKTGKYRKTKKSLDPLIEENLQILGGLSVSREYSWDALSNTVSKNGGKTSKKLSADHIVPDDMFLSNLSFLDAVPEYWRTKEGESLTYISKLECSMKDVYSDIPEAVLVSHAVPHDAKSDLEEGLSIDDDGTFYDRASNVDNIIIPKISSMPTSSTDISVQKYQNFLPGNHIIAATAEGNISAEDVIMSTKISVIPYSEPLSKKVKNCKKSKITKKSSKTTDETYSATKCNVETESNFEKEFTKTEIFIPKVKPIPLGTSPHASSIFSPMQPAISSVLSSESSLTNPVQNLPFECPESFQIITKFPLFPKEIYDWLITNSQNLDAFKIDVEQISLKALPSVKTILNKTMSDLNRFFLNRWREGMIKELGEDGFKQHQHATIRSGLNLHANIMEHLSGKPISELQIMPENEGHWCSLQSVMGTVNDVRALEVEISHDLLPYRGVFDCLARYKDLLCLIDWKTSKKPRPLLKNTYDDPIQVAAYIGALNSSDAYVKKYGEVSHGVVVVIYPDGSPAHIHVMNKTVCEQHWRDWTERLYNFYQLTFTEKMAASVERRDAKVSSLGAAQ